MKAAALILLLATAAAQPHPYTTIYRDDSVALQVRAGKSKALGNGRYRAWLRWLWAEPQRWKGDVETATVRIMLVDCGAMRVKELGVEHKNAKGEVYDTSESDPNTTPWTSLGKGTAAYATMSRVCAALPRLLEPH